MFTRTTRSAEETQALAAQIGARLRPGDVLLLHGGLGAGKTTFVQGLARGMGIEAPVTSPTFALIQEYRGERIALVHFDPYRLEGPAEVAALGFEEYLEQPVVLAVEWPERLGNLTPAEHLSVGLQIAESDDERLITFIPAGIRWETLLRELESC